MASAIRVGRRVLTAAERLDPPELLMTDLTRTDDELTPATVEELAAWMSETAAQPAIAIFPAGGRTSLHYGFPLNRPARALSTAALTRVVDYPARDMTVTVEAGIRISDLQSLLAGERQRLAVDIPQAHRATVGGAIATNSSGPRRFGLGTLRDYVIGLSAVDAHGRAFKSGGRVVKNVAGYDLCKLLIGSLGTLAVVTQVTFKLKPIPEQSAIIWASCGDLARLDQALEKLTGSATRPVMIDLLDPLAAAAVSQEARLPLPSSEFVLAIGLEGIAREVDWQIDQLRTELQAVGITHLEVVTNDTVAPLWSALTEYQIPSDEPATFRANLRPSRLIPFVRQACSMGVALQAHAASGIVHGHLPDSTPTLTQAEPLLTMLRTLTREAQGNLVLTQCDDLWKAQLPVFGHPEQSWSLMRKLKQQLDPQGRLSPGRLFKDL